MMSKKSGRDHQAIDVVVLIEAVGPTLDEKARAVDAAGQQRRVGSGDRLSRREPPEALQRGRHRTAAMRCSS